MFFINHFPYWISVLFMMTGLYIVMSQGNLMKKVVGLNIFQISVFLSYILMSKVRGGTAPILKEGLDASAYSNPLPHVLILTAIVVGIATTALAYALIIRIHETYGSIEETDIYAMERKQSRRNMARWLHALERDSRTHQKGDH